MKTSYYFIKWLFKDYKFSIFQFVFVSLGMTASGAIMTVIAIANPDRDEHGYFLRPNPFLHDVGEYFIFIGMFLALSAAFYIAVIAPLREAFNKFKQEQRDLLTTIDKADKQ